MNISQIIGEYKADNIVKSYTGSSDNESSFVTDTSLSWKIWNVSPEKIILISDKPLENGGYKNLGAIDFANCNGYNNAVKILNDICLNCYSNNKVGAVSRSINVDDIEEVINKESWRPEMYKDKKTQKYTYTDRKEYVVTKCYPVIFRGEDTACIDGNIIENGLKRSEQSILFDRNKTYLQAEKSLEPMQTAWTKTKMNTKNFIDDKYYYMIFKDGENIKEDLMSYFLASRGVNLNENNAQFDIFEVSMGSTIKTETLFNSRGGSISYWNRVRPMVEIPKDNVVIDKAGDGLTKASAWKIICK